MPGHHAMPATTQREGGLIRLEQAKQAKFAIVSDEDQEIWARCLDVKGFFVPARADQEWRRFELIGCAPKGPLLTSCTRDGLVSEELGNAELCVLDVEDATIGGYYLGGFTITSRRPYRGMSGLFDVVVDAL